MSVVTRVLRMERRELLKMALVMPLPAGAWAASSALPELARCIVGFAPGAGTDVVARRLSEALRGKLAASVIVDNRTGAAGRIAVDAARLQAPDGLTLLLNPSGVLTVNPHTYRQLGYRPFEDLTPISLVCLIDFGFAVGPAVPVNVRTLNDFVLWARIQGAVSFGSPAAGAPPHFVGDAFSRSRKLGLVHVPYRGTAPMMADLLGGQLSAGVAALGDLLGQAKTGKLRILAVTGPQRSQFAPDLPTFTEQGITGLDMRDWFGVYIAGKASSETVDRVGVLVRAAADSVEYRSGLASLGFEAASSSAAELDRLARADFARWGELVKASGFMPDA